MRWLESGSPAIWAKIVENKKCFIIFSVCSIWSGGRICTSLQSEKWQLYNNFGNSKYYYLPIIVFQLQKNVTFLVSSTNSDNNRCNEHITLNVIWFDNGMEWTMYEGGRWELRQFVLLEKCPNLPAKVGCCNSRSPKCKSRFENKLA